jgi:hypothetical protein
MNPAPAGRGRPAIAAIAGALLVTAVAAGAGATWAAAAGAVLAVYVLGYVVGALVVDRSDEELGPALAAIRTVAGLLLSTLAFLLCLVLTIPWWAGPALLVATALGFRRKAALSGPRFEIRWGWDGIAAGVLTAAIMSPVALSLPLMGRGAYPPVFYNIDTAYTLEKVHGLTTQDRYPPGSLSNLGARRTYHYGTMAMGALVSRTSGLPPHQSMFLLVMPLLILGVAAAAAAAAREIGPGVPRVLAVPLLLLSIPSISGPFWASYGPQIASAAANGFPLSEIVGDFSRWGVLSNEGQNVGGDFVILAAIASLSAVPRWGRRLPALLIGSAMLVKSTVGVALVAGFALSETWTAIRTRRLWPSRLVLMAAAVFVATLAAFFLVSFESYFFLERYWLNHWQQLQERGIQDGFWFDVLWLLLPALVVVSAGIKDPDRRSVPLLLFAVAPVIVINVSRLDNKGPGGGGAGNDWLQIAHAVPFFMHAFALSLAGRRWDRLGAPRRAAFLALLALAVGPVVLGATSYSVAFLRDPANGNEFVDNRAIAEALAVIPTRGTLLVTNDLRYPAQNFARDDRQAQIPAIFGHQAFAVNYAYEDVETRKPLQELLRQTEWSDDILDAARSHGWTHLLVHKAYQHPAPIPLPRLFESEQYEVYRFP